MPGAGGVASLGRCGTLWDLTRALPALVGGARCPAVHTHARTRERARERRGRNEPDGALLRAAQLRGDSVVVTTMLVAPGCTELAWRHKVTRRWTLAA